MMYVVTAAEMREMDRQTIESFGIPGRVLMENAGRGAGDVLLRRFARRDLRRIGIAAGRGNNGGDGFVIARYLAQKGLSVTVYLLAAADQVQGDDAAANLALLTPLDVPVHEITDEDSLDAHKPLMAQQTLWVDAILGTGLKSDVKGFYRSVIEWLNASAKPILAIDIPSGLDSDTGQPLGICVQAHTTATFAFAKFGHLMFPGADATGHLETIDIGIPPHIVEKVNPLQHRLTSARIRQGWKPRASDAHKGTTGHLLLIAGSPGRTGAAAMAAMAAVRSGAGLVTLGIPESLNPILESQLLEAMTHPLPETPEGSLDGPAFEIIMTLLSDKKCLAIGPGIGTHPETGDLVRRVIAESPHPVVIDADGLNCLVGHMAILKSVGAPIILTPHPGEMARLTGKTADEIQKERMSIARDFAVNHHVHLVLKGAGTLIAHPNGHVFVNATGNSGMASGGMGDVLTGLIAGLITQGYSPEMATHAGVYLHGRAADTLASARGPIGFLAGDIINRIPEEIQHLLSETDKSWAD
jgi:hydroxyethylthiazole kinase-like uncharacterized protein yjeF